MEKHIVSDMAKGARIGIGFFLSLAVLWIGASFAAATWGALPQASSGSTLSSSAWNDVVDHVNAIAGAVKISSGKIWIGTNATTAPLTTPGIYFSEGGWDISAGPDIRMGAQGLIATDSNLFINIDSENASTSRYFAIAKDSATQTSSVELLRLNESAALTVGTATTNGKIDVYGPVARTGCPTGMASAGQYCVDTAQRASATWNVANDTCFNENKRLCSANEWASACRRNVFARTPNNWNWTEQTYALQWGWAYYYYAATVIGYNDCNYVSWSYSHDATSVPYRCCADRVLWGN